MNPPIVVGFGEIVYRKSFECGGCAIWTFTIYGFFSIACANKPDGTIDTDTVMVRARLKKHLENLKARFPALANGKLLTWANRDYRYRLIVPKEVWAGILREMAEEQEWSNFKNQAASRRSQVGTAYIRALHEVWGTMYELQESERSGTLK